MTRALRPQREADRRITAPRPDRAVERDALVAPPIHRRSRAHPGRGARVAPPAGQPHPDARSRSRSLAPPRLTALLVTLFAAVALVITAAGIAGVVSFVNERTTEIGVRMALGAPRSSVVRMISGSLGRSRRARAGHRRRADADAGRDSPCSPSSRPIRRPCGGRHHAGGRGGAGVSAPARRAATTIRCARCASGLARSGRSGHPPDPDL